MALIFCRIMKGYDFKQSKQSEHNKAHIYFWKEYEKACIKVIEEIDDLYMIVWDNDKPKKVRFGSKSVWSYSKFASYVDASDEVLEKYYLYTESIRRQKCAKTLVEIHKKELAISVQHKLKLSNMRVLRANSTTYEYNVYLTVLTSKYRNRFKQSYQKHLINCINKNKQPSYYDKQNIYSFVNSNTAENK